MPTNPIPVPMSPISATSLGAVKSPTRDVVNISALIPQTQAEEITRLLFEEMSAIELAELATYDSILGIDQKYSVISNLTEVRDKYSMTTRLSPNSKRETILKKFSIDLNSNIPNEVYIEKNNLNATNSYLDESSVSKSVEKNYVYIDKNGDLIIELDAVSGLGYTIEIEIDTNGTIYEVDSV